jgi:uncharacterized membrane protein YfcA
MELILLFAAAFLGGALNSVAGGGSFISFPALVSVGVPSINANATNTMALWPGSIASVGAYRAELARQDRRLVLLLSLTSLLGGLSGAEILLRTPQATFDRLLPWLMLFAVGIFAVGGNLTQALRRRFGERLAAGGILVALIVAVLQFLISVYGGFFGGGIGILMLAALALAGMTNIHTMNGLKVLLATLINGIAVLRFVIAGTIFWQYAVIMIIGAILGGYGGAAYAQRLDPKIVRRFVIAVGVAMTVYFFIREYAA